MKQSYTAVLEQESRHRESFVTEPWESAWAIEARWFVRIISLDGGLRLMPELSPDGLHWCEQPDAGIEISKPGVHSFAQTEFGPWLRLRCDFTRGTTETVLFAYLSLKG